jgi:hypothetical protein
MATAPAYGGLRESPLQIPFVPDMHPVDWRLEHFVADLLLECEPDYIAASRKDGWLNFHHQPPNRQSEPIAAALAITDRIPR